jgi:hypothetical protein
LDCVDCGSSLLEFGFYLGHPHPSIFFQI